MVSKSMSLTSPPLSTSPTEESSLDDVRGRVDIRRGPVAGAEHTQERHHDDGIHVDVPEASLVQVARQAPPAPIEGRAGLRSERGILERGIDPDAHHGGLGCLGSVDAAQPPTEYARDR